MGSCFLAHDFSSSFRTRSDFRCNALTMWSRLSLLLLSGLWFRSHAFVLRKTFDASRVGVKSMAFDPSHVFETASTFLADASDSASALVDTSDSVPALVDAVDPAPSDYIPGTSGEVSYSRTSYYTILGLYVLSFPGLWSTVKRSTSAKIKRKTFVSAGENADGGKGLRQQAGEIMAYMKSNNYEVVEAGETITFRGIIERSLSQAFFLTFCTAIGFASLALVLQIQFQDLEIPGIGQPNWFLITLLAPYAGLYYWRAGDRVDDCSVKLETNDEETENSITVQGSEEELERMWRTLDWQEKGMLKVPGLLDGA